MNQRWSSLVFLVSILLATASRAPAGPGERAGLLDDLAFVPAEVHSVIVVRDARLHRRTPVGQAMTEATEAILTLPRTRAAWRSLAAMLKMEGDVAFDEILGRRVVFLERDAPRPGGEAEWTIVCDVTDRTARALRRELKAAPRRILEGVPMLAIEDGRFEMAVVGRGDTERVLLAPASSFMLMRETASRLEGKKDGGFLESAPAHRLRDLGDGEALFWRTLGGDGQDAAWVGGVVEADRFSIKSRFVVRTEDAVPVVPATSLEIFEALRDDALLTIVETVDRDAMQTANPGAGAIGRAQATINDLLLRADASRYAVVVKDREEAGISVGAAICTPDAGATAASVDRVMNELLLMLAAQAGLGAWNYDFAGVQPEAMRIADLSEGSGRTFALLGQERLKITWGPHADTWWVAGLPGNASGALRDAIDAETNEVVRPWLVVGSARPSRLMKSLAGALPQWGDGAVGPLGALALFDEVTWTTWRHADPKLNREIWARVEVRVAID